VHTFILFFRGGEKEKKEKEAFCFLKLRGKTGKEILLLLAGTVKGRGGSFLSLSRENREEGGSCFYVQGWRKREGSEKGRLFTLTRGWIFTTTTSSLEKKRGEKYAQDVSI